MTAQQIENGLGLRKALAIECRKLIETTKKASTYCYAMEREYKMLSPAGYAGFQHRGGRGLADSLDSSGSTKPSPTCDVTMLASVLMTLSIAGFTWGWSGGPDSLRSWGPFAPRFSSPGEGVERRW